MLFGLHANCLLRGVLSRKHQMDQSQALHVCVYQQHDNPEQAADSQGGSYPHVLTPSDPVAMRQTAPGTTMHTVVRLRIRKWIASRNSGRLQSESRRRGPAT